VADAAALSSSLTDPLQLAGALGVAASGLLAALYSLERRRCAALGAECTSLRSQLAAAAAEMDAMRSNLEAERRARNDAESFRPRLDAATRDVLKLERALEIKDGQLDTFVNTARRQIRALEDDIRALQGMT
jgi:chromosome segregation ATPase